MDAFAGSQLRVFAQLLREMGPRVRGDRALPAWIQARLAREKRFGSRDRRAYRELLYTAVRHWSWIEELLPQSEDAALRATVRLAAPLPGLQRLKAAVAGPSLHDLPVAERAQALGVAASLLPEWVGVECPRAALPPEIDVLHRRAPLWLRFQTRERSAVLEEFSRLGWTSSSHPRFPDALQIHGDVDVTRTEAFLRGDIEVQDLGSQWVLHQAGVATGERWLDACAGAGGKTLPLAQLLGPTGSVEAHDVRRAALVELAERAQRARLKNVKTVTAVDADALFDGVLVDAPCTGTGTWRRSPHLKWCTRAADVLAAARIQQGILQLGATHVRPGGVLVYATCSLARSENEGVVEHFVAVNPEFVIEPMEPLGGETLANGTTLWPSTHDTDGFFAARLRRRTRP